MAATRTKKTIRLNPLAVDATTKPTRLGLLSGASATELSPAKKPAAKKSAAKKPAAKKSAPKKTSKVEVAPVATPAPETQAATSAVLSGTKKLVKTARKKIVKAPPQPLATPTPAATGKPASSGTSEQAGGKAGEDVAKTALLRNRPVAQVRYGDVLSVREIVPGPKSDELGFYEASGEFVSLMHLEGPIDQSGPGFFPLALAGLVMGGGLGFVTASILNIRKQTIFLARQSTGTHKYVSLDWRGLSHLKRMAFKLGR